ncbi:uncharacterized protein BKA55DRAFT_122689 [Fusarium redolens]|uniref:Uncharacterized protein n=1 Tax=Fusarium redolens TaxID=48865 RepID=A0A9P9GDH7_FUSRE|nr:uncharacterized protein BKA55DRAFT_122689 [Fusarium redolens]KAH7237543.1 hypothetical protein BKA55DRAFT_122689 [Fusarium redolens]
MYYGCHYFTQKSTCHAFYFILFFIAHSSLAFGYRSCLHIRSMNSTECFEFGLYHSKSGISLLCNAYKLVCSLKSISARACSSIIWQDFEATTVSLLNLIFAQHISTNSTKLIPCTNYRRWLSITHRCSPSVSALIKLMFF